jgi:hypothetical protein
VTRWLGLALIAEGHSDDLFLPEVLRRSAQDVCGAWVDVAAPLAVRAGAGPGGHDDLIQALEREDGAFAVVVFHQDGKSHPDAVRLSLTGFREKLRRRGRGEPLVPVVPVQETEAWAMADGDALRSVLGVTWSDAQMGLPRRTRDLEADPDPKTTLRRLFERATRWDVDFLGQLGECVSLERLRELPSFRCWENDLAEAWRMLPGFTTR